MLRSCGATVLGAEDVGTAQRYVSTVKLDLIVTDLALPGVDGASFLTWLREQPSDRGGSLPAVAVTAYHERYPPAAISGWAAYFQKPLDEVRRRFHEIVRKAAQHAAAASKQAARPLKPSVFSIPRQRKTA